MPFHRRLWKQFTVPGAAHYRFGDLDVSIIVENGEASGRAICDGEFVGTIGAVRYATKGRWHITDINSMRPGVGVGSALAEALWRRLGRRQMTVISVNQGTTWWPRTSLVKRGQVVILSADGHPDGYPD